MTTTIETYMNSFPKPEDILTLEVSGKTIKSLPNLTRFKNLEILKCFNNELISLPSLPNNLIKLFCSGNNLTYLPNKLPENLKVLHCYANNLTYLPALPKNLEFLSCHSNSLTYLPLLPQKLELLFCSNNQFTYLPSLPKNLKRLTCFNNQLTYLPDLPENLEKIYYNNNPIYEIVNSNTLFQIKINIQILNNFRHLYYCLKFKKQLRKWLWEKVREPYAMKKYSPLYLIKNLRDEDDLDTILVAW